MTTEPGATEEPAVLLVDDLEDNLFALQAVLCALGVPLIPARSGAEALEELARREFAVVLLDTDMPGMDGFATAARIKRLDRAKDVPIVFLTSEQHAREAGHAFLGRTLGTADYLAKPFDPWVLRAKVGVFLDLYRRNRQVQRLLENERNRLGAFAQRLAAVEEQLAAGADAPGDPADRAALRRRIAALEEAVRELRYHRSGPDA